MDGNYGLVCTKMVSLQLLHFEYSYKKGSKIVLLCFLFVIALFSLRFAMDYFEIET